MHITDIFVIIHNLTRMRIRAALIAMTLFVTGWMPCVSAKKVSSPQVLYSLPRTQLAFEITLSRTDIKAGPYFNYGERLLALKDVATEDKVVWTLNQINVMPIGEPDKDKTFKIKSAKSLVLNDRGIICGLNVENVEPNKSGVATNEPIVVRLADNDFDPRAYYEEQLQANSLSMMAENAAKQIYRIRDSRVSLSTGDVVKMPADGESMRIMFDEMDKQEAALVALFEGKKHTTEVKKVIFYTPGKKSVQNELVFRISKSGGVVEKDDLTGDPVYLTITAKKNDVPSADVGSGELFYNIPGSARVQLTYQNQLIFDADIQIAQMGSIQALPSSYKNSKLRFNPATGALIEIE